MKTNVGLSILFGGVVLGFLGAGCPATVGEPCAGPVGTKCPPDEGEAGADGPSSDAPQDAPVEAPSGCNASADPQGEPKCVDNDFAVFVNGATGLDSNPGTKEQPLKTIGASLSKGKPRVYVCEGTYAEHVKVTSGIALVGGFSCMSWTYSGTKAKVAPTDGGYALEVAETKSDAGVWDLSFVAPDATAKGESSIATFVHGASKVSFVRSELEAGTGKEGDDGAAGTTGAPTAGDLKGNAANGVTPGLIKTCTCTSGGTSTGGAGGGPTAVGANGLPNLAGAPPNDGAGGAGNVSCNPSGAGHNGTDASSAADAPKATMLGVLSANGWTPQAGNAGANGTPGQGGGGGGGRDVTSAGGGGACGGCSGTGGKPGAGGGASVALLSLDSSVALGASTLTSKAAGQGGAGGAQGPGAAGGTGGVTNGGSNGCAAGDGGRGGDGGSGSGGDGGSGSGGAGGVSAAVVHKGAAPTNEGSTLKAGAKGGSGSGGTAGSNDGPDGASAETLALQ